MSTKPSKIILSISAILNLAHVLQNYTQHLFYSEHLSVLICSYYLRIHFILSIQIYASLNKKTLIELQAKEYICRLDVPMKSRNLLMRHSEYIEHSKTSCFSTCMHFWLFSITSNAQDGEILRPSGWWVGQVEISGGGSRF